MDIAQQLLVTHSRANADLILAYLLADEARTQVLVKLVKRRDPADAKIVQRAGMVLGDLGRMRPDWLVPYQDDLLDLLDGAPHVALVRAVTRYFSELPLSRVTEAAQGRLLEHAFSYLADAERTVTVRVYSMTILLHFAELYPELTDEIRGLIEVEIVEGAATAGFLNRGRKVLRALERLEREK